MLRQGIISLPSERKKERKKDLLQRFKSFFSYVAHRATWDKKSLQQVTYDGAQDGVNVVASCNLLAVRKIGFG